MEKILQNRKKFSEIYENGKGSVVTVKWGDGSIGLNQIQEYEQKENQLNAQANNYYNELDAINAGFDNVPTASFFAAIPYMMTLGYGCPMKYQNQDLLISTYKYKTMEEAKSFEYIPNIYEYGLYKIGLERIMEFQEKYPYIPIAMCDLQSPIDVITEFLPMEEAILMFYDDPDNTHKMLDGITKSISDVCNEYKRVIKNFAGYKGGAYLPKGIHFSDDNAAFLSPSIYKEYAIPYANRLSKEFGGISFHVCMKFEQNLKNLASVDGFLGFDAMPYYNNPVDVINALGENKVYNLYDYSWTRPMDEKEAPINFYKRIIDINENRNAIRFEIFADKKDVALKLAADVKDYLIKVSQY